MTADTAQTVHTWGRFEVAADLAIDAEVDPLRHVQAAATFTAPSGRRRSVAAFWDGGQTWRARFSPDEAGTWQYSLVACVRLAGRSADAERSGTFECLPYTGENPLYRHGPPRMAGNRRHLAHADGTPFFFLSDTVWNGPLLAAADEWDEYISVRQAQGFTAAQFVTTQWRTAPDGGPDGPAYTGGDRLERVNPGLFRRLDARLDALADAGIVSVPVLLWAIKGGEGAHANPGNVLSEDDAALLARYQVARWHAHPVVWILNGDGKYTGDEAERWRRIGRMAFADWPAGARAPVATHPGGRQWVGDEFKDEPWLDVVGYQSGHGDDEATWRWLAEGPPARQWPDVPRQAVINLEPCYEDHVAYHSKARIPAEYVRRACYWSLLVSPTAGVSYGGHGVWGWDDGSGPPVAHARTGVAKHWREALQLPGAQQLRHLADAFRSFDWWTLRPDQSLIRDQPGVHDVARYVTAARSEDGRLAVLYLPAGGAVPVDLSAMAGPVFATWVDPRTGDHSAEASAEEDAAAGPMVLEAPDDHDWLVVLEVM